MKDVVVIGGGIAGLAAAERLARARLRVTLLEGSNRLGGNLCTTSFAGRSLDLGAEALLTRDPTASELCHELSLADMLVAPAHTASFVWTRRGLRPLPSNAVARLPGDLRDLLRSRLLSPLGLMRCGWDLVIPSRAPQTDASIGEVVRTRLGRRVLDRIVDPLLGGIHAGSCDGLSVRAVAPQLVDALGTGNGLIRGLRAAAPPTGGPAFATLRDGLGSLAAALAARARAAGTHIRLGVRAIEVDTPDARRATVALRDGDVLHATACVIATPARAAGWMLRRTAPAAAAELAGIVSAGTVVVALAYPQQALAALPLGTGFVTAGGERLVRACTWSSSKWEHLRGDPAIVKAFLGRAGTALPELDDRELGAVVHRELSLALGLRARPVDVHVERFPSGIPQYAVGHLERVARIEEALPPQLALAGASYRGAGLSACVRSGRAAADHVLGLVGVTAEAAPATPLRSLA